MKRGRRDRRRRWTPVGVGVSLGAVSLLVPLAVLGYHALPGVAGREAERFAGAGGENPGAEIDGVVEMTYAPGQHVGADRRVAYDQSPPYGGPHDRYWATCTGTVYSVAIRSENAVHSLEHGAVWVTYDPDRVGAGLASLTAKVEGRPYLMVSPYPGLHAPVTVQAWGRHLDVPSVDDERIDRFVAAFRQNPDTAPEVGASCATLPEGFDPANPPPWDPTPPGPDALPMPAGETSVPGGEHSAPA